MPFSPGSYAKGSCDRCGFTYSLSALRAEFVDGRPTGLLTCSACWDPDHPLNQRGREQVFDYEELENPRPDVNLHTSTTYVGWMPIGNPITGAILCEAGRLTVTIG